MVSTRKTMDSSGAPKSQSGSVHDSAPKRMSRSGTRYAPGRDRLGPGVQAHARVPRRVVGHVVAEDRARGGVAPARMAGRHLARAAALLAPHEEPPLRPRRRQRVEGRLARPLVEQLRPGLLLRAPDGERVLVHHLGHLGERIVEIPHQDRLRGTHDHARRLEAHVQPVRAEVALLGRSGPRG